MTQAVAIHVENIPSQSEQPASSRKTSNRMMGKVVRLLRIFAMQKMWIEPMTQTEISKIEGVYVSTIHDDMVLLRDLEQECSWHLRFLVDHLIPTPTEFDLSNGVRLARKGGSGSSWAILKVAEGEVIGEDGRLGSGEAKQWPTAFDAYAWWKKNSESVLAK